MTSAMMLQGFVGSFICANISEIFRDILETIKLTAKKKRMSKQLCTFLGLFVVSCITCLMREVKGYVV